MIKIVIKDDTISEKEIAEYLEKCNLQGKKRGVDYEIITKEQYEKEVKENSVIVPFSSPDLEDILPNFYEPTLTITEMCQKRTERQKKEQEKWRRKFYRK